MRPLAIVSIVLVCLAFLITLIASLALSIGADHPGETLQYQTSVSFMAHNLGWVIAIASGLALLLSALLGSPLERLAALAVPLLGGALLIEPHWSLGLSLGAVAMAFGVREIVRVWKGDGGSAPKG